ncbi:MAG: DUF4493 domain-containing protein [Muribaculaceae bacterium]|nr:DUF4493 domain-containing protein [Muribaculaceae bacterium]
MKHFYAGLFLAGFTLAGLTSCNGDDNPWRGNYGDGGTISLNLTSDGGVFRSTRGDDTKATIVPAPEEFSISLSRTDGSSSQRWANITAFNKEKTFPIGEYTLSATYGNPDVEGFTNPYYEASETVVVTAGDEKSINLTATLANCMVSIRYTDDFNAVFPSHSAAVKTAGHDFVVFAGDETRPAYMYPDEMSLSLTMTNAEGKQVTIQPAGFTAKPRRHYIVTIGVTGLESQGNLALDVQFEEDVVAETINVPLGDDLFEAPAPTIETVGFNPDDNIQTFENLFDAGDPRYKLFAFGGLKEVNLEMNAGSSYNSPFGNKVQLVNASALDQSNVAASGIEVFGLYRNPDKMGEIKLKGMLEKLPVGTHSITVQVMDAMTRVSDPVKLTITVTPISILIAPASNVDYFSKEAEVYVSTNSKIVKDNASFTITSENLPATVVKIEPLESSPIEGADTDMTYNYKYTIASPKELTRDMLLVKLLFGKNNAEKAYTELPMDFPKFSILTDAFANRAILRIVPEDPSKLDLIANNLVIANGSKQMDGITRLDNNTDLQISGLTPGFTYTSLKASLSNISNPAYTIEPFTTEELSAIPNGDFSAVSQTLNFTGIQVGGKFAVNALGINRDYQHTTSIVRSEADGWASLNSLTCYENSATKNTWFMVPSTFAENGEVVIRTVGYNHNGTVPAKSGGSWNTKYYCENAPTQNQLEKSGGELFLGSYSYDGAEHRSNGIDFTSRPAYLTFDCQYTPYNNDKGQVIAEVYDAEGNVISKGSMEIENSAEKVSKTIKLSDYAFGSKAAKLYISFRSTASSNTPAVNIPSGTALNEGQSLGSQTIGANSYKAFAKGSEMVIDNVKLLYGANETQAIKKTKRAK